MSEKNIKIGSNILLIRDGKVLFGKRLNCAGAGTYGVVGGHVEFGESPEACAIRELKEETGLVIDKLKLVSIINDPRQDTGHYMQFVYLCDDFQGEPQLLEPEKCEGWEWFGINNPPANIFFGHRDFLRVYN
jgi:8-oxo-dGTP diphosphatase